MSFDVSDQANHYPFLYFINKNFKMKKTFFMLSMLLQFISIQLFSQGNRKITTDDYQKTAALNTPAMINSRNQINKQSEEFKKNAKFKKVVLPLVFHVLYKAGAEYPSEAQVLSQVDALNKDFDKKNYKSKHKADSIERFIDKAGDMEIQFCLAKQNPTGVTTNGINFINTNSSGWGMASDIKNTGRGGQSPWDVDKYINIWVADLGEATNGYAQMPGGPKETDGIVIDYRFFGTTGTAIAPYNLGKTLTHLIGNYLNLFDLWGSCYCCDDLVDDTPIHNAPNYGATSEYRHVSLCPGNGVELSMNFMDNTDDEWMYMFTNGQKLRMQAVLADNGIRAGLVNNNTSCKNNLDQTETRSISKTLINIFPNPARGDINFSIDAGKGEAIQLIAIDQMGRIIKTEKQIIVKGINNIKWNAASWTPGIYTIKAISADTNAEQKLIIY